MNEQKSTDRLAPITGVGDQYSVKTEKRIDGTLVTTMTGTANVTLIERLRIQLMAELDGKPHDWIIDASDLEKFDPDTSEPFVEVLVAFKAHGGDLVVVIANDNKIKMRLSSFTMSSVASGGPKLEIVATLNEAMACLRRRPEETDGRQ